MLSTKQDLIFFICFVGSLEVVGMSQASEVLDKNAILRSKEQGNMP
jgi:hypothetical protein